MSPLGGEFTAEHIENREDAGVASIPEVPLRAPDSGPTHARTHSEGGGSKKQVQYQLQSELQWLYK